MNKWDKEGSEPADENYYIKKIVNADDFPTQVVSMIITLRFLTYASRT